MPTRKTAAQRRRERALCSKESPTINNTRIEGTLGKSLDDSMVERQVASIDHVSQIISETSPAQENEEPHNDSEEQSCGKASEPRLRRSSSQNSIQTEFSTDEGASSCGRNSTPSSGEGSFAGNAMQKDFGAVDHGSAPACQLSLPKPLWVDNGLKGDATAWLLVRPKSQHQSDQLGRPGVPNSPHDTMLLGPYVSTKNTFLEEGRVEDRANRRLANRSRAQSIGACKFGIS